MCCYSQRCGKSVVEGLHLFLLHIPIINLNEMDYRSANMKWLSVLPNNGHVKSNVPLSFSFSSFPHLYFYSYTSSNSRTGFWKHVLMFKSLANFFFFYILLPFPASLYLRLYSLLCSLFYKLTFCLHFSGSNGISATSRSLLHFQSPLDFYIFAFLLSS